MPKTKFLYFMGILVLMIMGTSMSMQDDEQNGSAADLDIVTQLISTKKILEQTTAEAQEHLKRTWDGAASSAQDLPPETVGLLYEYTKKLQSTIKALDEKIGRMAQSYALSEQCSNLRALLTNAQKHSKTALTYINTIQQNSALTAAGIMIFNCEIDIVYQFLDKFFSRLAHSETHIAHTRNLWQPVQEALDGLLHQARDEAACATLPIVRSMDIDPAIIPGITRTMIASWRKARKQQLEQADPDELLADTPEEPAEAGSFSLAKIIGGIQKVRAFVAEQARAGSATDRTLSYVTSVCEKARGPLAKLRTFLEEHKGENLNTQQNRHALEFLVVPSAYPTTLCMAQRAPKVILKPIFWLKGTPVEDQETIISALKRNGFQPSDLARLSEKFCAEFGFTQEDREDIKQRFPAWLEKASSLLQPERVDSCNRSLERVPDLVARNIAVIRSLLAQHDAFDTAAQTTEEFLQKLVDHHDQVLREESEEIARLKELGEHAQEIQKRS